MEIKVMERIGEGEFINYEFRIDLGDPGFLERFSEEREKALQKYLETKRRIIKK